MLLNTFLITITVSAAFGAFGGMVGREQSVGVRGTLLCNGKPESNVLIKLYDDDRGNFQTDLIHSQPTLFWWFTYCILHIKTVQSFFYKKYQKL